jgi:nucleotide-binding universal stress UspA family protein
MGETLFRSIVVGVDGSRSARSAALWAAHQAAGRNGTVRLVHVIALAQQTLAGGYVPPPDFLPSITSAAREHLYGLRDDLVRADADLVVETRVCSGQPASVLIEEARSADLVVVGGPRHGGLPMLGSATTAVSVVAHARCPAAIIAADAERVRSGPVVVGIDGSPISETAIQVAFEEASLRRAELLAVHAWNDPWSDSESVYLRQLALDWTSIQIEERRALAERLAGWQEKFPEVTVHRMVARQHPAQLLLGQARDAQLLVVGSRGHGGFAGMLLGSVSRKLIYQAGCPLLIARENNTSSSS